MRKEQFIHVNLYLIFSYFLYKKKVATPHHLPKKRDALKKYPNHFFKRHQVCGLSHYKK